MIIDPLLPFDTFALQTPLVGIAYSPGRMKGYYVPIIEGEFRLAVRLPSGIDAEKCTAGFLAGRSPAVALASCRL